MKKLLLIFVSILALSFTLQEQALAQTQPVAQPQPQTTSQALDTLTKKIDAFLLEQHATSEKLQKQIINVNRRLRNLEDQGALRTLYRDSIPLIIMFLIGCFIVMIVFILTNNSFRNHKLKYDTIIRCTEMTGQVPSTIEPSFNQFQRQTAINPGARIYLFLSLLCALIGFVSFLIAINTHGITSYLVSMFTIMFFIATALLFVQFNQRNREDNRTNQQ